MSNASALSARLAKLSPKQRQLLALMKSEKKVGKKVENLAQIPLRANEDLPELSFAQQRLWFIDQLDPGTPAFNIPAAIRLSGRLDVELLEQGFAEIARRHETLRTQFVLRQGQPLQEVVEDIEFRLSHIDLQLLEAGRQERMIQTLATHYCQLSFDLSQAPLLRVALLRLRPDEHVMILILHHIVGDVWSIRVLLKELAQVYLALASDRPSPLPELPIQYVDYSVWQRQTLQGEVLDGHLDYWRHQMQGAPQVLDLPTDHPRPAVQSPWGAKSFVSLPGDLVEKLRALGKKEDASLYMVFLAAWRILLWRYSGQKDLVIGTPMANRGRAELEVMIGFFVNSLLLRTPIRADRGYLDLLRRERETTLEAFNHQDLPFERLVELLQPERDMSRNPLFQVDFVLQNSPQSKVTVPGLTLTPLDVLNGTAQVDLTLDLWQEEDGIGGWLQYDDDLFDASTVQRLGGHLQRLLRAIVQGPDARLDGFDLMMPGERHQLLAEWNDTRVGREDLCLQSVIAETSQRVPDRVAVSSNGDRGFEALSYERLDQEAEAWAGVLARFEVDSPWVAVMAERSVELVVALLAILKAGKAYVPLDPDYPEERLEFMLADASASIILTQEHLRSALPVPRAGSDPEVLILDGPKPAATRNTRSQATADHFAYMIFTSGSTGRPKGAMVSHRAIVNRLLWMQSAYQLDEDDRVLQKTPFSFDVSVWEFFWPLMTGAGLVMARPGGHQEPAYLQQVIREQRVSTLHFVPSMLRAFLDLPATPLESLRRVVVSGEALPRELEQRFLNRFDLPLHNLYGPTEAAVDVTSFRCVPSTAQTSVPIGRPIDNLRIHLLDRGARPVPIGVAGQLFITGRGLSAGYFGRPALTAEKFLPTALAASAGSRSYATGDLARYRRDGEIEFLGRLDHQIKLRGFRIELGEIEATLESLESVEAAIVLAEPDSSGGRLIACLVSAGDSIPETEVLKRDLAERLPEYMVPSFFVNFETFPLTPNGKVDRRALLRNALPEAKVTTREYVAPRTEVEEALCEIWSSVLDLEQVGVADHFFESGGHSLLGTQVISRLRERFDLELSLRELFKHPILEDLADACERLQNRSRNVAKAPPLKPIARNRPLQLSFAQERMWFIHQLTPEASAYNIPGAVRLRGTLDELALNRTFAAMIRRHEVLRTTFTTVEGEPRLRIHDDLPLVKLRIDLNHLVAESRREIALGLGLAEARRSFDLANGPLMRVLLMRLAADDHLMVINIHHIVYDMWSRDIFLRELGILYSEFSCQRPSPLPPLPIQYADFAAWQRSWLQGEVLAEQLGYWRQQLADLPPVLELPTDRPRSRNASQVGRRLFLEFSTEHTERLEALAREEGTTLFIALLTGFASLMYRYTGQQDFAVGSPIANRNREEIETLMGFFSNTLVLRQQVRGRLAIRDLLDSAQQVALGAYDHQDLPFERLVGEFQRGRDQGVHPLVQVLFNFLPNYRPPKFSLPGLTLSPEWVDNGSLAFDFVMALWKSSGRIQSSLDYSTELFDASTMQRMLDHYLNILLALPDHLDTAIDDLPLLGTSEKHQILNHGGEISQSGELQGSLQHEFERRSQSWSESIAINDGELHFTYTEFDRRAEFVAEKLRASGVVAGQVVALLAERSPRALIGLLGILKSGAAYLPLDPANPAERVQAILADAGVEQAVSEAVLAEHLGSECKTLLLDGLPKDLPLTAQSKASAVDFDPGQLAYVIYTSGSTGQPKGMRISHRNVLTFFAATERAVGVEEAGSWTLFHSLAFDVSVWEVWGALLSGSRLVTVPYLTSRSPTALADLLLEERIQAICQTPSAFRQLLQGLAEGERVQRRLSLDRVFFAGEALDVGALEGWYARPEADQVTLWNLYGITETTVYITCHEVGARDRVEPQRSLIGQPLDDYQVYVCHRSGHLQPIGIPGELWIGGPCLGEGYLGRPGLTAERFVPTALTSQPGARLYRSGDLGRLLEDGTFEYFGRIDYQVKIRGFRIEPEEIEAVLAEVPGLSEGSVVVREDREGNPYLTACVVPIEGQEPTVESLHRYLRGRLPEYMVPSALITLEALPLTASGKVDRRALESMEGAKLATEVAYQEPRNELEAELVEIWTSLLEVEPIGVFDNFFDRGGHSLLTTQLISRLRKSFQVEISLQAFFENPTIEGLAQTIDLSRWAEEVAEGRVMEGGTDTEEFDDDFEMGEI